MNSVGCKYVKYLLNEQRGRSNVEFDFINISYTVVISDNVCQWTKLHKVENTLAISY